MQTKFGQRAKDVITGFSGTITGKASYITGCNQSLLSGTVKADGDPRLGSTSKPSMSWRSSSRPWRRLGGTAPPSEVRDEPNTTCSAETTVSSGAAGSTAGQWFDDDRLQIVDESVIELPNTADGPDATPTSMRLPSENLSKIIVEVQFVKQEAGTKVTITVPPSVKIGFVSCS